MSMFEIDRGVVLVPAGFERVPQFSFPGLGASVWLRQSQPAKAEHVCAVSYAVEAVSYQTETEV